MTLPVLGLALIHDDFAPLKDWILGADRALEIQDFVGPDVIAGDCNALVALWQRTLAGHAGRRGIHGPFFGIELTNPDTDMRAIIQRRYLHGIEIAEALGADQMVIHSPFTYWHVLNRRNYAAIRPYMFEAAAECLAPVLARAADVGCTVVIENVDDTDPADRVDLAAMIAHPNFRVSLDTGHADLAHGRYNAPPVVDYIDAAAGWLAHVHLQDADGYADRHWHPGEGRVPWRAVFGALAELPEVPRLILEVRGRRHLLPQTVARLEAQGLAR